MINVIVKVCFPLVCIGTSWFARRERSSWTQWSRRESLKNSYWTIYLYLVHKRLYFPVYFSFYYIDGKYSIRVQVRGCAKQELTSM